MTPETAFFHKLLLQAGISDRYDEYIDHALINNNPLSNLLLDLAFFFLIAVKPSPCYTSIRQIFR